MMFWSFVALGLALLPALMFLRNLPLFRLPDGALVSTDATVITVSVLIPARNEADSIAACVQSVLASRDVDLEVLVLDDDSDDATAAVVRDLAKTDSRVRCLSGQPLPPQWNGKQHACWQLASAARHSRLLFLDADVRLQPHAIKVLIDWQNKNKIALLSAFPQQQTETLLEKLLVPMMHYILLGFLPMARMRAYCSPAYAAGCGQLFLTSRSDYEAAGTHQAIKASRHDGLKLPRIYRLSGMMTDVVDGTRLARCRMYRDAGQVIRGLLKNADEGIANPKLIGVFTLLIFGASVLPVVVLAIAIATQSPLEIGIAGAAVLLAHLPRALAAIFFRQPPVGVLLHSVAATLFIGLQWSAFVMAILGKKVRWRGRF
ncbi:glycosyl transferase family 2 [Rhodopirellula maiorica SM1]|uniref:Glycosyl transferase family 2 n=1 Tax=Rhodopirellula maiorica SM1 TaxID=1265738 RepID=M5REP7_9BACT|nr:glycosyltransferase family A protein [Rhodopirellula maiorica]EMI17943.1 glycosyl transferase family 2 [Rhodopirellula maiorica SM1]